MSGWKNKAVALSEKELRETLQAASAALAEIAQTKGLDPNGERARDMCDAALAKLKAGAQRARKAGF